MNADRDQGPEIRLGVSSCLLGEEVRYDGGHKRNTFLVNTLDQYITWVPVCPEVEVGMGTPRETIRLVGASDSPRLVGPASGTDYTDRMISWAKLRVDQLADLNLHGYILKKDSPSCGLFRVRVYKEHTDVPSRDGQGLFASVLASRFPALPVEEEGRLNDPPLRENFIERIFIYQRWLKMIETDPTPAGVVAFHTDHKMTLLSHSPRHYRELGRIVADAGSLEWKSLVEAYSSKMMEGLTVLSTPGKHSNVIQHLMGFLKDSLTGADKDELLDLVTQHRQGLVPLIVPLTLLKHHLNRHKAPDWARRQTYLNPYPKELMLRNHV